MKKILCIILVSILVLSSLAACGKPAKSSASGSAATTGDTVKIRFMDITPRPERQAFYENVFDDFYAATNIEVVYESVPWDDANNKLTIAGSTNTLPDIFPVHKFWLSQFTEAGWLLPLNDKLAASPLQDSFVDYINKIYWVNQENLYGNIYTVPDGVVTPAMYVRKDWFKDAGIPLDDNWKWEDFFNAVETVSDPANRHYGLSFRGGRGSFDQIVAYLRSNYGGRIYDEKGNVLFTDEAGIAAFEKYCSIYLNGNVPQESVNWGFVEMVDNFTGGLTAMLLNDAEVAATCQAVMDPEQWTILPFPKSDVDGLQYAGADSAYSYGISATSEHPEAAWQLIEYLNQPEIALEYSKIMGFLPALKDIDDPLFKDDGPYAAFNKQLNDPDFVIPGEYGPFDVSDLHESLLHEEVQKYLLGQQTSQETLENIATPLEERMKQYLIDNPEYKIPEPASMH